MRDPDTGREVVIEESTRALSHLQMVAPRWVSTAEIGLPSYGYAFRSLADTFPQVVVKTFLVSLEPIEFALHARWTPHYQHRLDFGNGDERPQNEYPTVETGR